MVPDAPVLRDRPSADGADAGRPAGSLPGGAVVLDPAQAMALPAKLRWALVGWYRTTGRLAEAGALLDAIEGTSGESGTVLEERARLATEAGRHEQAVRWWEARVERSPSATVRVELARAYLRAGDVAAAERVERDLVAEYPDLVGVRALRPDVARAQGDFAKARVHHEAKLRDQPGNARALLDLAQLALDAGDAGEAARLLDCALLALLDGVLGMEGKSPTSVHYQAAGDVAERIGPIGRGAPFWKRAATLRAGQEAQLWAEIRAALGLAEPAPEASTNGVARAGEAFAGGGASPVSSKSNPPAPHAPDTGRAGAIRSAGMAAPMSPAPPPVADDPDAPGADEAETLHDEAPDIAALHPEVLDVLRREFGHEALRPGQAAVIANVLARRDTLATMPTGAGKSLTFQLPAMLLEGVTLVISPLIALMKDQFEGLPAPVRARTALVNSTLGPDELRRVVDEIAAGAYRLVYAAPERLRQHAFLRALREAGVALVVIDEAHCISMWGHDFRPDYLSIPKALPELGDPSVLAITATATKEMKKAIGAGLGRDLKPVHVSLFRPNLSYEAHRLANREQKIQKLVETCHAERRRGAGSGIVYVSSRKDAEGLANVLRDRGIGAVPYHAGLDPAVRAENQERFMRGEPRAQVVVATVAFGMGVDKPDVRFVVHLVPSRSLEAYAQESGRAGRDGLPARCILLSTAADGYHLTQFAARDQLNLDEIRAVYRGIMRAARGRWALVDPGALLSMDAGDADTDVDPRVAVGVLEQAGLVLRHPDAPATRSLWVEPGQAQDGADGTWARFLAWAGLVGGGQATVETAAACDALGLTPTELDRLLGERDPTVRDGRRLVCLELLPAGDDARARLTAVLERAKVEANRRIAQVMAYANGGSCRHAALAAHLGERLPPCRTACDVCRRAAGAEDDPRAGANGRTPVAAPAARSTIGPEDALAVLEAVRTLPFPMGKTGLGKLLVGSVESRVRADRSSAFGKLAGLTRGKVEGLIDRLAEDGFLFRNLEHEFKVITLTERGAAATAEDLDGYASVLRSPARAGGAERLAAGEDLELDPDGELLLHRLTEWRTATASAEAMPPYVIAHNRTLLALALHRPTTPEELGRIDGFGPKRVEKYGPELLALIAAG